MAPFLATSDPTFQFTHWYLPGFRDSGCGAVEDNYIANKQTGAITPGQDGIAETCVVNENDGRVQYLYPIYAKSYLVVGTTTLDVRDIDYNNMDSVKILDIKTVSPQPLNKNPNAQTSVLGDNGGVTATLYASGYEYRRSVPYYVDGILLAPLTATNDPTFDFIRWDGCASVRDDYDQNWQPTTNNGGTAAPDGVSESCVINQNSTSATARYSDHSTDMRVFSPTVVMNIRDVGLAGQPGGNQDPNNYAANSPLLGTFGGTTDIVIPINQPQYLRRVPGTGSALTAINGHIETRLVAPYYDLDVTHVGDQFANWSGDCTSTQDNYDKNMVWGNQDGVFETCVIDKQNGQMNYFRANYQRTSVTVTTSTQNKFADPDYGDIDNVKILEIGEGNAITTIGVDPNSTSTLSELGRYGGITSRFGCELSPSPWCYPAPKHWGRIDSKLLAPLVATNDPDYGFVRWEGCIAIEDNYNGSWVGGTDGIKETCVIKFSDGYPHELRAVYDDARSTLTINSNVPTVTITSPDVDFNNKITNFSVFKRNISTTLTAPETFTSGTTLYTFLNWSGGCNTTSGTQNNICSIALVDRQLKTLSANYQSYTIAPWGAPTTDQPTLSKNRVGTQIFSAPFLENGAPVILGTACQNTLKYVPAGTLKTYTGTIDNLGRCTTTVPPTDIPTLGQVELQSKIVWRGQPYVSALAYRFIVNEIYTETLYAYYDADHPQTTTGSTITDLSGRGNIGTVFGGAPYNGTGVKSWQFDGSTGYISSALPSNFSTDISFEVWYKRGADQRSALVTQYRNDAPQINRLALTNDGDKLSTKLDTTDYQSGDFISNTFWQQGTVTYETTTHTIRVYANGVLQNTFDSTLYAPSLSSIEIGRSALTDYFGGDMAVIRLYNSALDEAKIRQNFEAEKSRFGFVDPAIQILNLPPFLNFGTYPFSLSMQQAFGAINNVGFLDRKSVSSGWKSTVSVSNFTNIATGTVVPANKVYLDTNPNTRDMGSLRFMSYGTDGFFSAPGTSRTLINVSQYNGTGRYFQNEGFRIDIPAGSPNGNYTGTIEVTTIIQ